MKGLKHPKLPAIEKHVLEEIQREIDNLRENFIIVDLTFFETELEAVVD